MQKDEQKVAGLTSDLTQMLGILIAKYRLFFGFCPKCNSDAPNVDGCNICGGDRTYPPSKHKKQTWFNDYKRELKNERL
jgi:rRNA maturation endonuclease Nob1